MLPPRMRPVRKEMLDEDCWGLRWLAFGYSKCGSKVELRCPLCGVHRCGKCAAFGMFCPMCAITNPETYSVEPVGGVQ